MSWQGIVKPILQQYTESTDGSFVEEKESALVWHYNAADPDFGSLQVTHVRRCVMPMLSIHSFLPFFLGTGDT
jgi:trehalose-6-phosphatase